MDAIEELCGDVVCALTFDESTFGESMAQGEQGGSPSSDRARMTSGGRPLRRDTQRCDGRRRSIAIVAICRRTRRTSVHKVSSIARCVRRLYFLGDGWRWQEEN